MIVLHFLVVYKGISINKPPLGPLISPLILKRGWAAERLGCFLFGPRNLVLNLKLNRTFPRRVAARHATEGQAPPFHLPCCWEGDFVRDSRPQNALHHGRFGNDMELFSNLPRIKGRIHDMCIPSRELTYPHPKVYLNHDFPFPCVCYMLGNPGRYTPGKLTKNLKMMVFNRNLLFQGFIFRFHVSFRWGISIYFPSTSTTLTQICRLVLVQTLLLQCCGKSWDWWM